MSSILRKNILKEANEPLESCVPSNTQMKEKQSMGETMTACSSHNRKDAVILEPEALPTSSSAQSLSKESEQVATWKNDAMKQSGLLKELLCAICFEYFYLPVTLTCGHTYCRYCIGDTRLVDCPLCRKPVGSALNVNTVLANLVEQMDLRRRAADPSTIEVDRHWWPKNFHKQIMSVSLFFRLFTEQFGFDRIFLNDLVSSVIAIMDEKRKWSVARWLYPSLVICISSAYICHYERGDV